MGQRAAMTPGECRSPPASGEPTAGRLHAWDAFQTQTTLPLSVTRNLRARGPLADRLGLLLAAYHWGMVVARTDEEQSLLREIESLVGRPSSADRSSQGE